VGREGVEKQVLLRVARPLLGSSSFWGSLNGSAPLGSGFVAFAGCADPTPCEGPASPLPLAGGSTRKASGPPRVRRGTPPPPPPPCPQETGPSSSPHCLAVPPAPGPGRSTLPIEGRRGARVFRRESGRHEPAKWQPQVNGRCRPVKRAPEPRGPQRRASDPKKDPHAPSPPSPKGPAPRPPHPQVAIGIHPQRSRHGRGRISPTLCRLFPSDA